MRLNTEVPEAEWQLGKLPPIRRQHTLESLMMKRRPSCSLPTRADTVFLFLGPVTIGYFALFHSAILLILA